MMFISIRQAWLLSIKPHRYILKEAPGSTVLFGMAFMNTLTAFNEYGPGFKHFGHGSDADLPALESFLG